MAVGETENERGIKLSRKGRIKDLSDQLASARQYWWQRSLFFHEEDIRYLRFVVPAGSRVLELGCGTGDLLAALAPAYGLGVDASQRMVEHASAAHPTLEFLHADVESQRWAESVSGPFDFIILSDTIGSLEDIQGTLALLHSLCQRHTRVVIAYYAYIWEPLLKLAELLRLKMPTLAQNVLSTADIVALMQLADFEMVKQERRLLCPIRLWGLGQWLNRYLATLPGIRRFALRNYVVGRSLHCGNAEVRSASVIVPCRNERGNVEAAVTRLPPFCPDIEIIFVEGHSKDGTYEEALRVRDAYPDRDIKVLRQDGIGKADAVFKGFDQARGEVLMILDADLTSPPEQLGKFWDAIASGKAEYVHGTRLAYPMEREAMRFLNQIANWAFSVLFSWLLNQRITDTLCGTKVLRKSDYLRLRAAHGYFGDFDPFGDFELIFGSAKLSLKMVEIPIRYAARQYGETQISRFRHGWLLLKMVVFAYRKLKAF